MSKQSEKISAAYKAKSESEKEFPINRQARMRLAEAYFNSKDSKIRDLSLSELSEKI